MNREKEICPVCGSNEITRFEKESSDELTLGHRFYFKEVNYKCNSCHEEGDFFAETDKNYVASQKESQVLLELAADQAKAANANVSEENLTDIVNEAVEKTHDKLF